jgi:HD-like signal output (HDOD) protein
MSKPLKELIAEYIGRSSLQLPVFNPVALELQKLLNTGDANAESIESTIAKDPALVGQVLRMANSSIYAGLNRITTMRQALMRLGEKQVARLAMASAQLSLYQSKNALIERYMQNLWVHAYASAIGSGWVADRTGHGERAESAFLAGLLHDIGKLLILKVIEEVMSKEQGHQDLSAALVDEMLGSLHCEYGHMLMQHWNLPEQYCIVGRDHHNAELDATQVEVVIVRLLDQVCAKLGIGGCADPEIMPAASEEAHLLSLNEIKLAELEIALEDGVLARAAA